MFFFQHDKQRLQNDNERLQDDNQLLSRRNTYLSDLKRHTEMISDSRIAKDFHRRERAIESRMREREIELDAILKDQELKHEKENKKIKEENERLKFQAEMAQRENTNNAQRIRQLEAEMKKQQESLAIQEENENQAPTTGWNVLAKLSPLIFTCAAAAIYLGRR